MPPKASKRKAKTAASEDDIWGTADEQPRKKTRASASRNEMNDEYQGRQSRKSKSLPSWAEWQTTFNEKEKSDRRQFATDFKQKTDKAHESIQMLLDKSSEDLNAAGKKYAELFREACVDIQHDSKRRPRKKATGSAQEHQLFSTGQTLLRACRKIIVTHEQGNDASSRALDTDQIDKVRAQFNKDKSGVEKVLIYGAQHAARIVACNVDLSGSDERSSLTPPQGELSDPAHMALDMHQASTENLLNGSTTWGEDAIAYVEKFMGVIAISEKQAGDI